VAFNRLEIQGIPKREGEKHALQVMIPVGTPTLYPKVQIYLAGSFYAQGVPHNLGDNYTEKRSFVKTWINPVWINPVRDKSWSTKVSKSHSFFDGPPEVQAGEIIPILKAHLKGYLFYRCVLLRQEAFGLVDLNMDIELIGGHGGIGFKDLVKPRGAYPNLFGNIR
jgi:hypothetical protein